MDKSHEMSVMDQDKAMEIIDQLSEDGALDRYLLFNILGEPLMYSGLFELIKYAKSKGLKTKLVTNGSLLTQRNIDALIEACPTMIKVSVESLDGAVFGELRGTTIKFETYARRISDMISSSISAGPEFTTYVQLDIMYADSQSYAMRRKCGLTTADPGRENTYSDKSKLQQDIAEFLASTAEAGRPSAQFTGPLTFEQGAYENNDLPLVKLGAGTGFHIKTYERWVDVFSKPYPVDNSGAGCPVDNLSIHANGDLVLCCIDYNASTSIGNVFQQSVPEILTDPKNIKIIQDLRQGKFHFDACKSCQGHNTRIAKYVLGAKRLKTVNQVYRAVSGITSK
jgi:radical SAM protein with 4Fe4S-binding SPASM domain